MQGEAINETECFVVAVRSCNEAMSEVVVVLFYFSERRVVIAEKSRDLSVDVFYKTFKNIVNFLSVFLFSSGTAKPYVTLCL